MVAKPLYTKRIGPTGVVYFTKTPNGLHQVLYSTRIDLDLDSQYYFRPGSWPWPVHGAAGRQGGQNDKYGAPDDHGGRIRF